jgi:hypothetical protein
LELGTRAAIEREGAGGAKEDGEAGKEKDASPGADATRPSHERVTGSITA